MTDRKKGTFGDGLLEVTRKYIFPASRRRMMVAGGIGCLVVLVYFLADAFLLNNTFIARGPLSSNHANFESECSRCHQGFKAVTDQKCSSCHEKTNDRIGVYTFAAHYVYRSYDLDRIASSQAGYAAKQEACATCHPDHLGRDGKITHVPDGRCTTCHDYGSFNRNHPEFEFVRKQLPDQSTLIFTHIRHTKFVLEQKLNKSVDIVQACLYCHNPQPDGKTFKPINFDAHCAGSCHYPVAQETPALAIKEPASEKPGVETLEMIQRRRGPGTRWAFYTNPNEVRVEGGRVVKSPIYHKDPWILENLKTIRQALYPNLGLTDLLQATGGINGDDRSEVYQEALHTLSEYRAELGVRPEPEVQADLAVLDSLLRLMAQRIADPNTGLTEAGFLGMEGNENPSLSPEQRNELVKFALRLTKDCQKCHIVSQASIMRVRSDQRVLRRAEFDHRAHIIQRPYCLDCHTEIPVEQMLFGDSIQVASLKSKAEAIDSAKTLNIPHIQNCYECHTASAASNTCVTCHYMHPNKTNRANLRLFVERP
jgi:hypothetical protein